VEFKSASDNGHVMSTGLDHGKGMAPQNCRILDTCSTCRYF